jgi:formate hydrogenlyase subunit 4
MVLDHSGPDLAIIELTAAMKLFVTSALLAAVVVPSTAGGPLGALAGTLGVAMVIGAIESTMARLRLPRVKQFLIGSGALGVLALVAAVLVRSSR